MLCLAQPGTLRAWGDAGHRAVCEVAYHELSPDVRAAVDALLATDNDPAFHGLANACTWPDRPGDVQGRNRPNHYLNVSREVAHVDGSECGSEACLLTAIPRDLERLGTPGVANAERLMALKFLGHWVGDLHQPLHVSFADDRGGNLIEVNSNLACGTVLHGVWDTCIPAYAMERMGIRDDGAAFGRSLQGEISSAERQAWTGDLRVEVWADESLSIALRSDVRYCARRDDGCWYAADSKRFVGTSGFFDRLTASFGALFARAEPARADFRPRLWDGKRVVAITTHYAERFEPVVKQRIKMAGVRFAALLKQAFRGETTP
ncbi:MAG: S1/P1 nuclease [Myxococcales bacterium]|nr:S1/P1 nuclease [Myxococcales bacterium]